MPANDDRAANPTEPSGQARRPRRRRQTVTGVAGSGKPVRLFVAQHIKGNAIYPCQLAAIDASGHDILAGCDQFDRIDRGRVTALAGRDIQVGFTGAW
jgi:hypothetical protein